MFHARPAKMSAAALALFAFATAPAFAASEQEITDALTKLFKSGNAGTEVTLGAPAADGDKLVYSNVTVKPADAGETKIATLTLTGADLNGSGGLKASAITGAGVESSNDGTALKIASIEVVNPDVTAPSTPGGTDGKGRFDSFTVSDIVVTEKDKPPVTIGTVGVEASDYVDDYPHALSLSVENVVVDPVLADDGGQSAAQLKALGYDKLTLSVYGSGAWNQDDGTLSLDELSIDGADAGTITLSGTLGGFSPDVMKLLGQPNPPADLMGKITLSDATLTYEDASLAGRVLDMQAKEMGQPREAFVEQITAALPLMLAMIQNPPFQDKLAAAATTFLKDPKNLQISIQPAAPVSVLEIMGTAQTAPQTLPDQLKADVQANVELEE